MSKEIITFKPEHLEEKLIETRSWLISNKVNLTDSRFDEIYNNFLEIIEYSKTNKINEYIEKHDFVTYLYSLLDAYSFIEIYESFSKQLMIPKKRIRVKLNEIVKGPFLLKDENALVSNVNSRNTLFELELASAFIKKGIAVIDLDDVQLEYESYKIHIECKRLISKDRIEYNIEKAYEQLQNKLDGNNDRGIIALCLEKLPKIDDKYYSADDRKDILKQLSLIGDIFRNNYEHIWKKFINIKIISIILYIKFVSIMKNKQLLNCWQVDLIPLCEKNLQLNDYNLLIRLYEQLQYSSESSL